MHRRWSLSVPFVTADTLPRRLHPSVILSRNKGCKMKLYSYIVRYDTGFAPNPFFDYCTVACCKAGIRLTAEEGDWIIGLTPKALGNKIVYFMRVDEILTFDEYWHNQRFKQKKPTFGDGVDHKTGDNIYEPRGHGDYRQLRSAHSKPPFGKHVDHERKVDDLSGRWALISETFVYFGSSAIDIPEGFKQLVVGIGYKCRCFSPTFVARFDHWAQSGEWAKSCEWTQSGKWQWGIQPNVRPRNPPRSDQPSNGGGCD
jgi:hypothetical protein